MRKILFLSFLFLILGSTAYVYWYYYNVYGDGFRDGMLQKFSRKGNVFKTYEGELLLNGFGSRNGGINANYFYFSVADEKVAAELENALGKNVRLHYTQYRRSLPWRGDDYQSNNTEKGQYIVDRVENVTDVERIY